MKQSFITRRQFATGALSTSLTGLVSTSLNVLARQKQQQPKLGVHLPLWHQGDLNPENFWEETFKQLHKQNIQNCLILMYRFVNPLTGKITQTSNFKKASAPDLSFLEIGLKKAQEVNIKCALYPTLEIDNTKNVGAVWRGYLNFFGVTLENFFMSYTAHLKSLAELTIAYNNPALYIGSELSSLTHNVSAIPHWEQLIYHLKNSLPRSTNLIYAAHWEEYKTIPFWRQLDEIGINAYFPLTSPEMSKGQNKPTQMQIEKKLDQILKNLKNFSDQQKRPLGLSEFGLPPYDQSTSHPWQQTPSEKTDLKEQINTYKALFNLSQNEHSWLNAINLWHWKLPDRPGSSFNLSPNTQIGELIKIHAKNSSTL